MWKIINFNTFNKPRDLMSEFVFYETKHRKLANLHHHLFQFNVWKKSMMAKIIIENMFLLTLTVVFQYFLIEVVTSA